MARYKERSKAKSNIKQIPIQGHIGAYECFHDDWKNLAYYIPITQLHTKFQDPALEYIGLYFCIGNEDGEERVYVGQGVKRNDNTGTLTRVKEHFQKDRYGIYKESWADTIHSVIIIVNENALWDGSELDALERIFERKFNVTRLNKKEPTGDLSTDCDEKIRQIQSYLSYIGVNTFTLDDNDENSEIPLEEIIDSSKAVEDLHRGTHSIPEIVTPHRVVKQMVDLLPSELFNPDTKFLDPACKGGEYLKAIYDRLMESPSMKATYPNQIIRSNKILTEQLFGIALSPISKERTTTKLLGIGVNIRVIPNYINILRDRSVTIKGGRVVHRDKFSDIVIKEFSKELKGDMKFDVAIGNPPYQESTGGGNGGSGVAIYHYFIEKCAEVADQTCLIVPARWMSDRPNGIEKDALKRLRERTDIVNIVDFGTEELFKGVNIAGGVCILHLKKGYQGQRMDTHGVIIRDKVYRGIINKVLDADFTSLANFIDSDCYRSGTHMNSGWKEFSFNQTQSYPIKYYCSAKDSVLGYGYVSPDQIIKNQDTIGEYKVAIQSSSPLDGEVINKGFILEPNSCCSRTYVVLHHTEYINSEEKANNAIKYLTTKFARACIKSIKTTQNASKQAYMFVPLQDFTPNSDIDWSKSIQEIDQQLYKKYNLTDEEITCIESTIEPITPKKRSMGMPKLSLDDYKAAELNNLLRKQNQV